MRIVHTWMALTVLAILLAGCAVNQPAPVPDPADSAAAFGGHRWLVTDPAALLANLPTDVPSPAVPPAPADPAVVTRWQQPVSRWMESELRAIRQDSTDPPRVARAVMLLGVAMNDGLSLADAARAQGADIADDTVLAEAAWRLLAYNHPLRADLARSDAATAAWVGVWRGADTAAGVANGRLLGAALADAVIAWAAADGSTTLDPNFTPGAAEPGRWQPAPPDFQSAQEPAWGTVATVVIGDPASVRAPAPPAWESPAMQAQESTFAQIQAQRSPADLALARQWQGGMGTVTPPGMWVEIAHTLIVRDQLPARQAAGIYAAVGVALHDAAVACWESKYFYQVARPIQWMRTTQPQWAPPLSTPPHPSYPSGHATFSGAAAAVLAAAFPQDTAMLVQDANDAARSRVIGGIHWPMDGDAGLAQGRAVATRVLAQLGK